jgi:hypothetical protein
MSEWRGLPLAGIAWDGAVLLGVNDDGLYSLDAASDGGAAISAWIETGLNDFGLPVLKRASNAYFGLTADGALTLEVGVTSSGAESTYSYAVQRGAGAPVQAKAHLGKGLLSRYWRFRVSNSEGADFTLHDLRVLFDDTARRA